MSSHLLSIPVDILVNILNHLEYLELESLLFFDFINQDVALKALSQYSFCDIHGVLTRFSECCNCGQHYSMCWACGDLDMQRCKICFVVVCHESCAFKHCGDCNLQLCRWCALLGYLHPDRDEDFWYGSLLHPSLWQTKYR